VHNCRDRSFGAEAFESREGTILRWLGMAGFLINSRGTMSARRQEESVSVNLVRTTEGWYVLRSSEAFAAQANFESPATLITTAWMPCGRRRNRARAARAPPPAARRTDGRSGAVVAGRYARRALAQAGPPGLRGSLTRL